MVGEDWDCYRHPNRMKYRLIAWTAPGQTVRLVLPAARQADAVIQTQQPDKVAHRSLQQLQMSNAQRLG
jgi:hypothetical protein